MKRITVLLLIMIMVLTNAGATFAYANETVLPIKAELFAAEEPEISFTVSEKITAENTNPDDPMQLSYSDLIIRNNASPLQLDSISASGTGSCTLVADSAIDKAEANSFSMVASVPKTYENGCFGKKSIDLSASGTETEVKERIKRGGTMTVTFTGKYVLPEEDVAQEGASVVLTFSKDDPQALVFESENDDSFVFVLGSYEVDRLKYSYDGETYYTVNPDTVRYGCITVYNGRLYLKGYNGLDEKYQGWSFGIMNDAKITLSGDLICLLDYDNIKNGMKIGDNGFVSLFSSLGYNLVDARDLKLPDPTVDMEFFGMFEGCTDLEYAPKIPAANPTAYCYQRMFYDCTSLKTIPALPATTLSDRCYDSMFRGCTSLKLSTTQSDVYTNAYTIPAGGTISGELPDYALTDMFADTGGSFTGTPDINTTYYTSNTIVG